MREIPLTQGKVALVDDADYEYLNQWKWHAARSPAAHWYAQRKDENDKTVHMHRLLLDKKLNLSLKVDHKDGYGLNNQKDNLRPATRSQNSANQKRNARNRSGYKGVDRRLNSNRWRAKIEVNGKYIHLGHFARAIDAAVTYDTAAQNYFGEFACLNFNYDPACYI